jgi:hypothetical protein
VEATATRQLSSEQEEIECFYNLLDMKFAKHNNTFSQAGLFGSSY